MNFLAHLFLSGNNREIMIGNFIADHVKGKAIDAYPVAIQNGIMLHRKIDYFTDHHPVVELSKSRLRPGFRKYAPVIADIFYDHFLAKNWLKYHEMPLKDFAESFYSTAREFVEIFPERTQRMLPVMISHDWLSSYSEIRGIDSVLTGMSRRTPFDSKMENASLELVENYSAYESEFRLFFPELIGFTNAELRI